MTSASAASHTSAAQTPHLAEMTFLGFDKCKGIRRGPVFLIASGGSARNFPVEEFAHVPMITMNGAISLLAEKDIAPYFYVCSDRHFSVQQPRLYATAMRISENVAIWQDQLDGDRPLPRGGAYALEKTPRGSLLSILLHRQGSLIRKRSLWSSRCRDIGFSKDMSQGFFDARTVMYVALQLACHLGFEQVFLVGFDLNPSAGRFYETCDRERSLCGLDQHYHKRILPSLKLMVSQVVNDLFRVFNLSSVSRVPENVIPRISLEAARQLIKAAPDAATSHPDSAVMTCVVRAGPALG